MSALAPFADSSRTSREVREVPLADICSAAFLFDHLVGALLQNPGHIEAKCLGGLEVDHQLELDWGLDGKLARLRALEDEIGIARRAPKIIGLVRSIGQQAAEFSPETIWIDGRQTVASSQRCDRRALDVPEAIRHHNQATVWPASLSGNDGFEFGPVVYVCGDRLHCEGGSGGFEGVQVDVAIWRRCRVD